MAVYNITHLALVIFGILHLLITESQGLQGPNICVRQET